MLITLKEKRVTVAGGSGVKMTHVDYKQKKNGVWARTIHRGQDLDGVVDVPTSEVESVRALAMLFFSDEPSQVHILNL